MASKEGELSSRRIVVLGTGGTIAGRAASGAGVKASQAYVAGEVPVADLLGGLALPMGLQGVVIESEQVAQIDSKDMEPAVWEALVARVRAALAQADVVGVVITHGTDTLEETALLLHRTVAAHRPVVLVAAMRPSDAALQDGPQNLIDALSVAALPDARGVLVVMDGQVLAGAHARKIHPTRLDAVTGGDAPPVATVTMGAVTRWRNWPPVDARLAAAIGGCGADDRPGGGDWSRWRVDSAARRTAAGATHWAGASTAAETPVPPAWPWVAIVSSHAGADGREVDALCAAGVQGIVVAATGNGTVHHRLDAALERARAAGIAVRMATRCTAGSLAGSRADDAPSACAPDEADAANGSPCSDDFESSVAAGLTPAQARVELQLQLRLPAGR